MAIPATGQNQNDQDQDQNIERWEYQTRFMEAKARKREVKRYIRNVFGKRAKRYSPESLIPELNALGDAGWEVIHMEPVPRVGGKEDFRFFGDNWSNTYFVVLKRRKTGEAAATATATEIKAAAHNAQASNNGATPDAPPPPSASTQAQGVLPFDQISAEGGDPSVLSSERRTTR
jgi:hypothetical protein